MIEHGFDGKLIRSGDGSHHEAGQQVVEALFEIVSARFPRAK